MFELYVFTFHNEGNIYRSLALIPPEQVHQSGLPTEAVLGEINALLPTMTPDQFDPNPAFLELLHGVVRQHAPQLPDLQAQAKTAGTGEVILADQRVQDNLQDEDIIGAFKVSRGEIVADSYQPNPAYRLLSDKGPLQLPEALEQEVMAIVKRSLDQPNPEAPTS